MQRNSSNRSTSLTRRLIAGGMVWCVFVLLLGGAGLHTLYGKYQKEVFYARLIDNLKLLRHFHNNTPMIKPNDITSARTVFSGYPEDGQYSKPYSASFWQIRGSNEFLITSESLVDCELTENVAIQCSGASLFASATQPDAISEGEVSPKFSYSIYSIAGPLNQKLRVIVSNYVTNPYLAGEYQYSVAARHVGLESVGRDFLIVISTVIAALILGTIAAIYLGARYGLKPLHDLQTGLRKIRAGQATRLDGDYPVEIKPIVREFHEVIRDRNRMEVENLAHRLKTPLSIISNQPTNNVYTLGQVVQRQTAAMAQAIEHYLERARRPMTEGILAPRVNVKDLLERVRESEKDSVVNRGIKIEIDCPESVSVLGDEADIMEMLYGLVDNGTKWATSEILISVAVNGESVVINIEDDGPGVAKEHRLTVLDRGVFLDPNSTGTGIGLANAREIAIQSGGSVVLKNSKLGGLRVAVTLRAQGPETAARPVL